MTDSAFDDVLQANRTWAAGFPHRGATAPATRGLAVLTCMDSRIDPLRALGLDVGDAKVLRNAGGRLTDDMASDLVLATHLLDVRRVLVLVHTSCAMASKTDAEVTAAVREGSGLDAGDHAWQTVPDQRARLEADVARLRAEPLLKPGTVVSGAVYDVDTGLVEVVVP